MICILQQLLVLDITRLAQSVVVVGEIIHWKQPLIHCLWDWPPSRSCFENLGSPRLSTGGTVAFETLSVHDCVLAEETKKKGKARVRQHDF